MPVSYKNAGGTWTPATPGKIFVLRGSTSTLRHQIEADSPTSFWPIRDPQESNVCEDTVGGMDTVYSRGVAGSGHPNPFTRSIRQWAVIPGGNPYRNFKTSGFTIECIIKTSSHGPIFGMQNGPVPVSGTGTVAGGHDPVLYVGERTGQVHARLYPIPQLIGARVNDGRYHHICLKFIPPGKSGQGQHLYVDGVWQGGNGAGQSPDLTSAWHNYAQIGAAYGDQWDDFQPQGWSFFEGDIYYFAVHNTYLPNDTIAKRSVPNWHGVNKAAAKSGPLGGGIWVDSGYLGAPGVPINFHVWSWNTSIPQIHVRWYEAPGVKSVSYEAQLLNEAGAVLRTQVLTGPLGIPPGGNYPASYYGTDYRWGDQPYGHDPGQGELSWYTKYRFRVRSKSSLGTFSPWSPEVRVMTGVPGAFNIPNSYW